MVVFDSNQLASSLSEEDDVAVSNIHVVCVSSLINTGCDSFAHDDYASSMLKCSLLGWKRQEFTKDFSFYYFVEDAKLCCLFWAESYKMVFVPFTAIDNYGRSVAVCSGLLKRETTEAYRWLQRAFKKAFVRAPNIVVAHQDGSIRLVVAAEFPESKHRLCMWHIM
ncbi:FAR1-related sequence 5-like protein [Tanacetum coccineum]